MSKKKNTREEDSRYRSAAAYDASGAPVRKTSKKKSKKARRRRRRRIIAAFMWLILFCILGGTFAGLVLFQKSTGESFMACVREGRTIAANSSAADFEGEEVTYIYSEDEQKIAELSEEQDSVKLTYDQIPENVINAFVAVEDRTFWTNDGTDPKGIARVLYTYARTLGKTANGASTITQQLVKLTYLSTEKTLSRKVKEIVIAKDITKKYSKEEIIAFYCNACCFANGIFGINDAAESYFNKSPEELTLSEAAYLCAIPNRPEYYNPRTNPENALARRNKILEDMLEEGYITQDEYTEAVNETITISDGKQDEEHYNYETTYAVNCAVKYIMKLQEFEFKYDFASDEEYQEYQNLYDEAYTQAKHELYTGGYRITTTIHEEQQQQMQEVLDEALADKDTKLDSGIYQVQGAMTVIDNETGKVVAIIGGRSQTETDGMYTLNRAYQGYAQPGSSIKPLVVYTPAMDTGEYDPSSDLQNIDVDYAKNTGATADQIAVMYGDDVTLRYAVENSLNGCAYWLYANIGVANGLQYLHQMDFSRITADDKNMSSCLGGLTYGVTTEEMANAYYTLENNGIFKDTDCLESFKDADGNELYEEPEETVVYQEASAQNMTDVMMGVLTEGTAASSDWYACTETEAAGKTGTTNDNKAAWFCGYTPYYTIAVWVGCDTPTEIYGLNGNSYPLTIWKNAMLSMIQDKPAASFDLDMIEDTEVEEDTTLQCTCSVKCTADAIDTSCPVCRDNYEACAASEEKCICDEKCDGDTLNESCPVCVKDPTKCLGQVMVCTCLTKCTADSVDTSCAVCQKDYSACQGQQTIDNPTPDEPDPAPTEPDPSDEPTPSKKDTTPEDPTPAADPEPAETPEDPAATQDPGNQVTDNPEG